MLRFAPFLLLLAALAAGQDPGEDALAFTLAGEVVDEAGEPVAGLLVQFWDALAPERFLHQETTGPNGRFLAALRGPMVARRDHPFGPVLVVARGRRYAQARDVVTAGDRGVRLTVAVSRPIRGIVLDYEDRPLPAVIVHAHLEDAPGVAEETTTGESGAFTLDQFGAQDAVVLSAELDGVDALEIEPREDLRVLRVPQAARGAGVVRDAATNEPVAGAALVRDGREYAFTGGDGAFTAIAGRYAVHAPGYVARAMVLDPDASADVHLDRAPPLRGVVVDAEDRPLSGCRVTATPPGIGVWTDDHGAFAFPVVPGRRFVLTAERAGFLGARVELAAGGSDDALTLRLLRGSRVAGTVMEDGVPAMGARVAAGGQAAYSDADGRFLLDAVPAEAWIRASRPGQRSKRTVLVGLAEGATVTAVTLALEDRLPLTGALRSDVGRPLANVAVTCAGEGDGEPRTATTDERGVYDFGRLPIRTYVVTASPADHAPVRVEAVPGDHPEVVAESRFGERRLAVAVEGASRAAPTITLVRREAPRVLREVAGRTHVFEGLAAGAYDVVVKADGYLEARAEVTIGETDPAPVRITMQRGGSLRLVASPGASVMIQRVSGKAPPLAALKLESGGKDLAGFGPGEYRFVSRAAGELIVVRTIELGPSTPPSELDLRGGAESTLTLTVQDPTGAPLADAEITLTCNGFSWNTRKRTAADGTVELDRLFDGRVEIRAKIDAREGITALDVAPGKTHAATLVIR